MTIENLGVKLYSGTKADRKSDSLGSAADGTNSGITKIGKIGAGQASFDGNDKASVTGQTIALSNDGWAVSGWFYSTTAGSLQMITYLPTSGSDIYLYKNTDNTIKTEGLGGTISSSAISTNQWYHFVINYDHSSTTTTLYLDGTSAGTATGAQAVNITSIEIGAEGSSYYWNGKMDDVAVFSRKLTSAEITSLSGGDATSTISATNLQALYTFDSNFNDSSTNSRNLTNSGVTLETAKLGTGAYSFDGSNDYVTVGSTSDWNFVHDGSGATVSAWVYRNGSQTGNGGIFVTEGGQSTTTGFGLGIRSGGNAYARTINTSNQWQVCEDTNSNISTGEWHHILATIDSSSIKLYVDGTLNSSHTISGTLKSGNSSYNAVGRAYSGSAWSYLNGNLDDMGVWKRVLTATEISDLVNAPNSWWIGGTSKNVTIDGNTVTTGSGSTWANWAQGKAVTAPTTLEFSVDDTNTNCIVGFGTGTGTDSPSAGSPMKHCAYLTSGGDIYWFDSTGEADTSSNRAAGDTYKLVWQSNGNLDLYLKPSGGSYGSSLKSWTSVTGTLYPMVQGYGGIVVTMLPTETADGALVSSLTDKSGLKAYYSMDSTSMGAEANYTTNFSSNTGWTESSGNVTIDTSDEEMDFHIESGTSGAKGYYDLTTVSDTNWVLRFENWNLSTLNTYGGMWMGISSQTSADGANSGSSIFTRLADYGDGDDYLVVASFNSSTTRVDGSVGRPALSTGTNYNIELSRDGTTVTTKLFTDNFKTPIATSTDTISGTTGLRYLFVGSEYQPASGNTNTNMIGTMQGIKFYNGVSAVDGCKNDFSTTSDLEALTGVRTNSIFQQTDVPQYYWYNGTSWLLDGSPPVGGNLHAWYDASDSTTVTKDSSNLVSQLNDKSGNGYNLTASGTGTGGQPLWVSGGKNDLDIIDFTSSKMMAAQWSATAQPMTFVAFMYSPAADGSQDNFWDNYDDTNSSMGFVNADTDNDFNAFAPSNIEGGSSSNYTQKWGLYTVSYNTTSSSISINGDQKGTGSIGTNSSYGLRLSRHRTSATYGQIKLAELLIYNKVLSSDELTKINDYFVNKWGAVLE